MEKSSRNSISTPSQRYIAKIQRENGMPSAPVLMSRPSAEITWHLNDLRTNKGYLKRVDDYFYLEQYIM